MFPTFQFPHWGWVLALITLPVAVYSAEPFFLHPSSLKRLSILYLTTCVGFQYGLDKPEA